MSDILVLASSSYMYIMNFIRIVTILQTDMGDQNCCAIEL